MQSKWALAALVAVPVTIVGLFGALALVSWPGIQVTVRNTGATPMNAVVSHVRGNSYALGDLQPDKTATANVHSTGESGLEIEFIDAAGETQRLNAGGYFEPGYRGRIEVEIKDGVIDADVHEIKPAWS